MPMQYSLDRERCIIVAKAWGVLVDSDVQAGRQELLDDPDFERDFGQLFDARDVDEVQLSVETMGRMAQTSILAREARRAFVANTPYQYRMACLFATLAQPYQPNVQVFRDIDEALNWLAG